MGAGAAALQFARSIPKAITAIVGHKAAEHVNENLELVPKDLLSQEDFLSVADELNDARQTE